MCVCVRACVHVCVCVCVCVCDYVCLCASVCVCVLGGEGRGVSACLSVCLCLCVCLNLCVYECSVCMCVHVEQGGDQRQVYFIIHKGISSAGHKPTDPGSQSGD